MAIIKCKMCGGELQITEGISVCECEYCGSKQTVPNADNEKKMTLFTRASRLLRNCEFDKASSVFENIVAEFPEEAEAYWGLVLCKYGIEYVDDPKTGKKIPTCHRSSFDSVLDDPNYEQACENTDAVARRVYRDEARSIEELREKILEVSGEEEPYDIFISYKDRDENNERTLDSVLAQDIYQELTNEGYRVFFSRISLEGKLGAEYEPYIFAALNSAKVMLVVGTDYENFDAVWVKNEWSRFLKLIAEGQKKALIPVYKNMDAYDMPKEFVKLVAQDMGKVGALQDLIRGIGKLLKKEVKFPNEIQKNVQVGGPSVYSLLDRGFITLEDEEWNKAKELFDQVLNIDPHNATAYLGLAMSEIQIKNKDTLEQEYISYKSKIKDNKMLTRAKQFADDELSQWFSELDDEAKINAENRRKKIYMLQGLIAAGADHTVGLKTDGTVIATNYTWDREFYYGQCEVSGWSNIVAISANERATIGLKDDNTVIATKFYNDSLNFGQCDVSNWEGIVSVAEGLTHTVGLKFDGTVISVGSNFCGERNVSSWENIVAIAAGQFHTVGLKADGTVIATEYIGDSRWNSGQCEISKWTDIIAIAAGDKHTVGLKKDGTVIATAYIGDQRSYFRQCDVSEWRDVIALAAQDNTTVGLREDGTVLVTGILDKHQEVSGWSNIVAVAVGENHIVGLKADGTLVTTQPQSVFDHGQHCVNNWKLFYNVDNINNEREKEKEKIRLREEKKLREQRKREAFNLACKDVEKAINSEIDRRMKTELEKYDLEFQTIQKEMAVEIENRNERSIPLQKRLSKAQKELSNLGIFKNKEKKALQNQIAEIRNELEIIPSLEQIRASFQSRIDVNTKEKEKEAERISTEVRAKHPMPVYEDFIE